MSRLKFTAPALTAALAVTTLGAVGAGPASAVPPCTVSGGGNMNEWSMTMTYGKNVKCSEAKRVMTTCGAKSKVPGWKVKVTDGRARFTKTGTSKRFVALLAGGSAPCVEAVLDF